MECKLNHIKCQLIFLALFLFFISCTSKKSTTQKTKDDTLTTTEEQSDSSQSDTINNTSDSSKIPPHILLMNEDSPLLGSSTGILSTSEERSKLIYPLIAGGGDIFQKVSLDFENKNQLKLRTPQCAIDYQLFYTTGKQHFWVVYEKIRKGKWRFRLLESDGQTVKKISLRKFCPELFDKPSFFEDEASMIPRYFSLDSLGFRAKSTNKIILRWTGTQFKVNQPHLSEFYKKQGVVLVTNSNCKGYELGNIGEVELAPPLLKALQTTQVASLSPQKKYLTYLKENKLYLYHFSDKSLRVLMELSKQVKGVSHAKWAANEEKLAFIQLTSSGTSVVAIDLSKKDSTTRQTQQVAIRYQPIPDCRRIQADFDFFDDHTLQYVPSKKSIFSYALLHLNQRSPQDQSPKIVSVGYNGLENYYYTLKNTPKTFNEIPQELIRYSNFLKPQISPDGKQLYYFGKVGQKSQSKYNFNVQYIQEEGTPLNTLLLFDFNPKTDNFSPIIWSPDGKRFAFVKLSQVSLAPKLKEPTTLYVFEAGAKEVGLLVEKNIPINYRCKMGCVTKAGTDFWFKDAKTLCYKKYLPGNDGKEEIVTISLD